MSLAWAAGRWKQQAGRQRFYRPVFGPLSQPSPDRADHEYHYQPGVARFSFPPLQRIRDRIYREIRRALDARKFYRLFEEDVALARDAPRQQRSTLGPTNLVDDELLRLRLPLRGGDDRRASSRARGCREGGDGALHVGQGRC